MTWNRLLTRIFGGARTEDEAETERAASDVTKRLEAATDRLEAAVVELYSALGQVDKE